MYHNSDVNGESLVVYNIGMYPYHVSEAHDLLLHRE